MEDSPEAPLGRGMSRTASTLFVERGSEPRIATETEQKASAVIDKRHMWLSKKIVQRFNMLDIDTVEKKLTAPEELMKVNQFLAPYGPRALFCLADPDMGQSFTVNLYPHRIGSRQIGKTLFFMRMIPTEQDVGNDISKDVAVGEFGSHVIRTFSHLLQNVYVPLLTTEGVWGTSSQDDRRSFFSQLSRFSMTLVDVVQTIESRVHFKKVDPFLLKAARSLRINDEAEEGGTDQQIEDLAEIARDWQQSAQQFLDQEDETLESLQDLGPDSPLNYWRERSAHLNALNEQFEAAETRSVVGVLTLHKSNKIKSWRSMEAKLKEATLEANENVKHLTTLNKNFEALYHGTPARIAEELPAIFSKLKMIRVMSKYLQSNRNMTGLLVKITNQVIARCRAYLNDGGGLWQQESAGLLVKLEECIGLNGKCQKQYRATKHERSGGVRELPFQFDESRIFAKLEHFAARLRKLRDFLAVFHLFDRLQQHSLPGLQPLCAEFAKAAAVFRQRPYDLLDFTNTAFDHDHRQMLQITAEMEEGLEGFIDESFREMESTEQALELLGTLHALMQRDNLRPYLNTKYLNIFTNFSHDLDAVSNMYELLKDAPPIPRNAPPVAGRILWVRHMLKMIEVPMSKFRQHAALMIHRQSKAIIRKYNKIAQAFVDFEVLWEKAWWSTVESAKQGMSATLLVRHPQDDRLHVNFDQSVLQVLREARFMRELEIGIPAGAEGMLGREEELKRSADLARYMLEEYHRLTALHLPEIRPLFARPFAELQALLRPGLTVVTWSSMSAGGYLQGMLAALDKTRELLGKVKDLYENRVQRNLRAIARVCLIQLPTAVVSTESFVSEQEQVIRERSGDIDHKCLEIQSAVVDIIRLVHACRLDPAPDHPAAPAAPKSDAGEVLEAVWHKVYQAVLTCITRSMDTLKARVKTAAVGFIAVEQPFFQVHVELVMPRVRTSPGLEDVQLAINRCALAVLRSIRITPWTRMPFASPETQRESMKDKVLSSLDLVPSVLVLTGCIERTKMRVRDYLAQFERFDMLWKTNKQAALAAFVQTAPTTAAFIEKLSGLDVLSREVADIAGECSIGPLSLTNDSLKASLRAELDGWKQHFTGRLLSSALEEAEGTRRWMAELSVRLESKVRDLDEVKAITSTLQEVLEAESDMDEGFIAVETRIRVAEEFAARPARHSQAGKVVELRVQWAALQRVAGSASDKLRRTQENFKSDLRKAVANFVSEVRNFRADFDSAGPLISGLSAPVAIDRMLKFQKLYEEKARKLETFQDGEELFGLARTEFPELAATQQELHLVSQLYTLYTACTQSIEGYLQQPVRQLAQGLPGITRELQHYDDRIQALPKVLVKYPACIEMRELVESLTAILPLVRMLINPAMRPRHWQEVMVITQTVLDMASPAFSLKELLDANLQRHQHSLHDVCQAAQQELQIEDKVEEVRGEWTSAALCFTKLNNTGPIVLDVKPTRALALSLEEAVATLHTLLNSQHSLPFREPINGLLAKFTALVELLDLWLGVQHVWWYVGVVFAGDDIATQLPQEAKRFSNVNGAYEELMQEAFTLRYAIMVHQQADPMRRTLLHLREQLEICQKLLTGFLDSKRDVFPRLYFVSDTVLLESLSSSADLTSLQPMLLSLFDSVHSLVVDKRTEAVTAIVSSEGETLPCLTEIGTDLPVEALLAGIHHQMCASLAAQAVEVGSAGQEQLAREELDRVLQRHQCQICLLGLQLWYSALCAKALAGQDVKFQLSTAAKRGASMLERASGLARGAGSGRQRLKAEAVLVTLLGQRESLRELLAARVRDHQAFEWQRQLRFQLAAGGAGAVEVQVMGAQCEYSFEFVGCQRRLPATPSTPRALFFLLQALALCTCPTLHGPAGCGKTGTIRELGRQLGRFTLDFNCSRDLTQAMVSGLLAGLCKAGAWGCLDEVGRVQLEVLSVTAHQIRSVLDALRSGKHVAALLDGQSARVLPTTGIFSCQAAGGPQHRELPENLREVLRVLAVAEPDLEAVAAVRLAAARLDAAPAIASKLRCLFTMSSHMLVGEARKRFGLRSLNAVVEALVALKRDNPDDMEELKAAGVVARDLTLPQLTEHDAPAFLALLADLFPDVGGARRVRGPEGLEERLKEAEEGGKLYPGVGAKAMQVYEASTAWHALALVGPTCTGKTASTAALLAELSDSDPHRAVYLNPMALTPAQLFGWHDERSQEWRDGVLAAVWRRAMRNQSAKTWLVLDGPVSPEWLEQLGTVLDDTRALTLANGDRIPMEEGARVVLEVDSLRHAGPNTVARTGLVAFESGSISIQAVADMWLAQRRPDEQTMLAALFDRFVNNVWAFAVLETRPVMRLPGTAQMHFFLTILSALLADYVAADEVPNKQVLERYVLFALAWATMGLLGDEDAKKVDDRITEITPNVPPDRPDRGTILNHFFADVDASKGQLQLWEHLSVLCDWTYPARPSPDRVPPLAAGAGSVRVAEGPWRDELVVPTVQSKTVEQLAQLLQGVMQPLLLVGEAGSGKTAIARAVRAQRHTKPDRRMPTHTVTLLRGSTSHYLQAMLEKVVRKRGPRLYGPANEGRAVVHIDDVNLPDRDGWGEQRTAEVLRELLEQGGLCSLQSLGDRNALVDLWLLAVARAAVGPLRDLPPRTLRHMLPVNLAFPTKHQMQAIFEPIVGGWVRGMPFLDEEVRQLLAHAVEGTVELVLRLQRELVPFRAAATFSLDLHAVARTLHGMMRVPGRNIHHQSMALALWRHECEREMLDQLAEEQAPVFARVMHAVCLQHFGQDLVVAKAKDPMFGDVTFTSIVPPPKPANAPSPPLHGPAHGSEPNRTSPRRSPRRAVESAGSRGAGQEQGWSVRAILGSEAIQTRAKRLLEDYEAEEGRERLGLVLFPEVVQHLVRLVRVLGVERGHAVVLGAPKSGKASVVRLAAHVARSECVSVTANHATGRRDLREALRRMFRVAGLHTGRPRRW